MRRLFLVLVAVGSCASIFASPANRAARVTVHVAVEDPTGNPVARLPAGTFSLSVDGVAQPIGPVVPADQPLSVILVVDDSPSMKPFAGRLTRPAREFITSLDAADRWRVGEFGDRITFSRTFASGPSSFRLEPREPIALRERTVRGGSPLWDAVHHSVELLADQEGRRRIVLVFTDGRASGNQHTLEEVAEFSNDNAASVSAIVPVRSVGIRQDAETMAVVSPEANLDRLARYTGGMLLGGFELKDDPLKQLRDVAARVRAGYTLSFVMPEPDGRRHRLDVRVATPGLQVRAPMAFRAVRGE